MNERSQDLVTAFDAVIKHLDTIREPLTAIRNHINDPEKTIGQGKVLLPPIGGVDPRPHPPSALSKCDVSRIAPTGDEFTLKNVTVFLGEGLTDCANTITAAGIWLDDTVESESQV
jgi:hypothetical protein